MPPKLQNKPRPRLNQKRPVSLPRGNKQQQQLLAQIKRNIAARQKFIDQISKSLAESRSRSISTTKPKPKPKTKTARPPSTKIGR